MKREHKLTHRLKKLVLPNRRVVIVGAIVFAIIIGIAFAIYLPVNRNAKESAYRKGIEAHESEELMSSKLADAMELHYEKGNYESVRPYIEETAALYSDGYAKLEALYAASAVFYKAEDWSSLKQFYQYTLKIARDYELDDETIIIYYDYLEEAKERAKK